MGMEPISIDKVKTIAKHYGLTPIKIKGTSQVNIAKNANNPKYAIISWDEFEESLNKKELVVCKAYDSCFLKIMKKKQ